MTEKSYYWDGTTIGDASLAPFTDLVYHSIWRKLFLKDNTTEGIICGYENALAIVGVSGGVTVDTGAALVDGHFYENDKKLTVNIPTPSSSTRIDIIVLRRDVNEQTVRAARVAGVEGGSAPSVTQILNGTWEIKIAEVSITTAGVITVTDYRKCINSPMLSQIRNIELIEEITPDRGDTEVLFDNISQNHNHLLLYGIGNVTNLVVGGTVELYINQDSTLNKYNVQTIERFVASVVASASNNPAVAFIGYFPDEDLLPTLGTFITFIPFYKESDFFKAYYNQYYVTDTEIMYNSTWQFEGTDPITSLLLVLNTGGEEFTEKCKFTLYGVG